MMRPNVLLLGLAAAATASAGVPEDTMRITEYMYKGNGAEFIEGSINDVNLVDGLFERHRFHNVFHGFSFYLIMIYLYHLRVINCCQMVK